MEELIILLEKLGFSKKEDYQEPKGVVGDDEKIIGEMIDVEKHLYTVLEFCDKKAAELITELSVLSAKSRSRTTEKKMEKIFETLENLKFTRKVASPLLWFSIKNRLKPPRTKSLAFRGFKVVEMSTKDFITFTISTKW
ncbi:MAG: hypothetical protein WCO35_00255 [Candidatus Nomurabacteria bacterium]